MSYMDQIPWWWILPLLTAGGGAAILAFVPGAMAAAIGIWNMLPRWLKIVLLVCGGFIVVYLKGRNSGHNTAKAEQEQRNARAETSREEIHRDVEKLDRPAVDQRLGKWMRD